ncbi:hypothetical protein PROCOU_10943 [Listeria rocourtiae FSL F6-920]|nr:hypothetical protein PROCOU_10943 [Listeria rocourtiae FSL F6-920]
MYPILFSARIGGLLFACFAGLWFRLLAYAPSHIGTLTQGGAFELYLILWWNRGGGSFLLALLPLWFRLLAYAPSHIGTLTQGGA